MSAEKPEFIVTSRRTGELPLTLLLIGIVGVLALTRLATTSTSHPMLAGTETPTPDLTATPGQIPPTDYPTIIPTNTPDILSPTYTPEPPPPSRDEPLPTLPAGTLIYPTAPIIGTSQPPYGP